MNHCSICGDPLAAQREIVRKGERMCRPCAQPLVIVEPCAALRWLSARCGSEFYAHSPNDDGVVDAAQLYRICWSRFS